MNLEKLDLDEITTDHMKYLINSATKVYKDGDNLDNDCSYAIMQYISRYDVTNFVYELKEAFPDMSPWARSVTLSILARISTEHSLKTLLNLLDNYIDDLAIFNFDMAINPKDGKSIGFLFPELFEFIEYKNIQYTLLRLIWSCLEKGTLKVEEVMKEKEVLLREYKLYKKQYLSIEGKLSKEDRWSEVYLNIRNMMSILLDIFSFLEFEFVENELIEALSFEDNRLKAFAIQSLLAHGKDVNENILFEVASDDETRNFLYGFLIEFDKEELFPRDFRNQKDIAVSELTNWLLYPTELGHTPSEIEFMEVIERYDEELGVVNFYLFRFKSDILNWEDVGWVVGVVGPYIKESEPTLENHGYTFSNFETWDSKKPEEHLDNILKELDSLWDQGEADE